LVHNLQLELLAVDEYCPFKQFAHVDARTLLDLPAGHSEQRSLLFSLLEKNPDGHCKQNLFFVSL
jgi:hypothetical protein